MDPLAHQIQNEDFEKAGFTRQKGEKGGQEGYYFSKEVSIGDKFHTARIFVSNEDLSTLQSQEILVLHLNSAVERIKAGVKDTFGELMPSSRVNTVLRAETPTKTIKQKVEDLGSATVRLVKKIGENRLLSRLVEKTGALMTTLKSRPTSTSEIANPVAFDSAEFTTSDANSLFRVTMDCSQTISKTRSEAGVQSMLRLTDSTSQGLEGIALGYRGEVRAQTVAARIHYDADAKQYYFQAASLSDLSSMSVNGETPTSWKQKIYLKDNGEENIITIGDNTSPLKIKLERLTE